jgi:hypothetical protein
MDIKRENVRNVISPISGKVMERPLSRTLIKGVCHSCGNEPPLTVVLYKEARRGTGTNIRRVHRVPQTLVVGPILRALKPEEGEGRL